jgi:hypothetical protein
VIFSKFENKFWKLKFECFFSFLKSSAPLSHRAKIRESAHNQIEKCIEKATRRHQEWQ